jgi:8-oxo-dGTP pyrophosphatase MutT (NUDIX family)
MVLTGSTLWVLFTIVFIVVLGMMRPSGSQCIRCLLRVYWTLIWLSRMFVRLLDGTAWAASSAKASIQGRNGVHDVKPKLLFLPTRKSNVSSTSLGKATRSRQLFLGDLILHGALAGYQISKQAATNYIDVDIKVTYDELDSIMNMHSEDLGLDLGSRMTFLIRRILEYRLYFNAVKTLVILALAFFALFFLPSIVKQVYVDGFLHTFQVYRKIFAPYAMHISDIPYFKLKVLAFSLFTFWMIRRVRSHCFYLRLRLDSAARGEMKEAKTRATQQMTGTGVASQPIITQVCQTARMRYNKMPPELWTMYYSVLCYATSATCDGECYNVSRNDDIEQDDPEDEEPHEPDPLPYLEKKFEDMHEHAYKFAKDQLEREHVDATMGRKEVIPTREPTHPDKPLRRGVKTQKKSFMQLFFDRERGEKRVLPGDDDYPTSVSGVIVGVNVCNVTAAYAQCERSELSGLQRHYGEVRHPKTGEELGYTDKQKKYMKTAGRVICGILTDALVRSGPEVLQTKFPAKWKDMTVDECLEVMAQDQGKFVYDMIKGFVKPREPGQPADKNARLITNPGVKATSRLLNLASTIEEVMKLEFPHLGGSGLTQDEQDARIADFITHAWKHGLTVYSGDFKSFDGTQKPFDREVVQVGIIQKCFLDTVAKYAELMSPGLGEADFVIKHGIDKKKIQITYHYFKVVIDVLASILFSGERLTSLGNRLLVLVCDGAEYIRKAVEEYGEAEGEDIGISMIHDMFYCPEELKNTLKPKDDKAHGRNYESTCLDINHYEPEKSKYVTLMGPRNFTNWGGGDDVLFVRPPGFYKDEDELVDRFADMHKIMDLCSYFKEKRDAEVLSRYVIFGRKQENGVQYPRFLPKAPKVFARLVFSKIVVEGNMWLKDGNYTTELTHDNWRELATEYWQRSYGLRHTPIVRHLCRAMFEYALSKSLATRPMLTWSVLSKYDDNDAERLGLVQGDVDLTEMIDIVHYNTTLQDIETYPLVKSLFFKTLAEKKPRERKRLNRAVALTDERWSTMQLDDSLVSNPEEFCRLYPVSVDLAPCFNYKDELIAVMGTLAKSETPPTPDVSVSPTPHGQADGPADDEASSVKSDGAGDFDFRCCCGLMVVDKESRLLSGIEKGSRKGMISIPWGKCEPQDFKQDVQFYKATAIRELYEETGYSVNSKDIKLAKCWNYGDPTTTGNRCFLLYCEADKLFLDENKPLLKVDDCDLAEVEYRSAETIRGKFGSDMISNNVQACINRHGREMRSEKYKLYEFHGTLRFEKHFKPERIEIFGHSKTTGRSERKCTYQIPHEILSQNWQPKMLFGKPMNYRPNPKPQSEPQKEWEPSLRPEVGSARATKSSSPVVPQEGVAPRPDGKTVSDEGTHAAPCVGGKQHIHTETSLRPAEPSPGGTTSTGKEVARSGALATNEKQNGTPVRFAPGGEQEEVATESLGPPPSVSPTERNVGLDSSDFIMAFPFQQQTEDTTYEESCTLTLRLVEIQRATRFPKPPYNPSRIYPSLKSCMSRLPQAALGTVSAVVETTTATLASLQQGYSGIDNADPDTADLLEVVEEVPGDDVSASASTSESSSSTSSSPLGLGLRPPRLERSVNDYALEGINSAGREPGGEPGLPTVTADLEGDNLASENLLENPPTSADVQQNIGDESIRVDTAHAIGTEQNVSIDTDENDSDEPALPPVCEDTIHVDIENVWIAEPRPKHLTYDTILNRNINSGYVISPVAMNAIRPMSEVLRAMRPNHSLIDGGYIVKAILQYRLTLEYRTYEDDDETNHKVHIGMQIESLTGFTFHDEDGEPLLDAHKNKHHITLLNDYRTMRYETRNGVTEWVPYVKEGSVEWAVAALLERNPDEVAEQFVYLCKWTPPDYEEQKQNPLMCVCLTQDIKCLNSYTDAWTGRHRTQEILIANRTLATYHISCHVGFDFGPCAEVTNEMMSFWEDFCNGAFHTEFGPLTDIEPEVPDEILSRKCYWRPLIRWANTLIDTPFSVPAKDLYYGLDTWGVSPHDI